MTKTQVELVDVPNVPNVDATALATTFGIAFVPTSLTTKPENFTKGLLLGAIVCVAVAVVLAALASARAPIKVFWENRALPVLLELSVAISRRYLRKEKLRWPFPQGLKCG